MSVDPYMRGRLRQPGTKSYAPAFDLEQPLNTRSIATVKKSKHPKFKEGDVISANTPIAEYAILPKQFLEGPAGPWGPVQPLDNPHNLDVAHFLGALGMPGLTACEFSQSLRRLAPSGDT
jgi:NADPH-dependent curcumin reductase CurA